MRKKHMRWVVMLTILMMMLTMVVGCNQPATQPNDTAKNDAGKKEPPKEEPKKEEPPKPSYPTKSVEFVVPFGAGGGSDILARTIDKVIKDNKFMDQPFVVVNKPGASGSIGYAYTAEKKGDPYTIATVSSSFYTAPILGKSPVSYKDFTPVAGLAMDTLILAVKSDSKYTNVKEIIEAAKAEPNKLTVGGTSGTSDDAVMYYAFADRTGTEMKYVPFNSGGEVMTAVLGGHVDMAWVNPGEALGQLEANKVKALAVASGERLSGMSDVPTLVEQDVNLKLAQFRGIVMPKEVPEEAVKYMEGVFEKLSNSDQWKKDYLEKNMIEGRFLKAADFEKAIVDTVKMYEEFLAKAGK